jgi:hypothetical protein
MQRTFKGEWSLGELHGYPFTLDGRGAYTQLHAHDKGHVMQATRRVGVYAVLPSGFEHVETVPQGETRYIKAHIPHIVFAVEDGLTECQCLFSRYGAEGEFRADPKEGSRQPYVETCDLTQLPDLVQKWLTDEAA